MKVQYGRAPVAQIVVPYFFGLTRDKAQALANDACLTARFSGASAAGAKVVAQSLAANQRAKPHAVIQLRMAMVDSAVVPPLVGLNRDAAAAKAEGSGLKPLFYGAAGSGALVAAQSRPSGQTVARGSFIQLQMTAPKLKLLSVPDFVGKTRSQAEALAASSHLGANFSGPDDAAAHVVGQNPAAESQVSAGAVVQLQLATSRIPTPNIVNRTKASAQAIITKRGLVLDLSGDQAPSARVSRQSPRAGEPVDVGSHIQAVMKVVAPPVLHAPNIVNSTRTSAQAIVAGLGLVLDLSGDEAPSARVSQQSPSAGDVVSPGSHIQAVMTAPGGSAPGIAPPAAGGSRSLARVTLKVPDVDKKSRAEAERMISAIGLVTDFTGDTSDNAQVKSQSPAAGLKARRGEHVSLVMAKRPASLWPLLAGVAVVLAGAAFLVFRPRPRPTPQPDPVPGPHPEPIPTPDPKPPLMLVTYVARVDPGRPTVRLSTESPVAARALVLEPEEGDQP